MDPLLTVFFAGLGALSASFAGVISERLYTGQSFVRGRSRCNSCGRRLAVLDLIPMLSWLGTAGRCRACRARVPYRYALSELALAVLFAGAYVKLGLTFALALFLVSLFLLATIVLYDLRHTVVPLLLSLFLCASALAYAFLTALDLHAFGTVLLTAGIIASGFFLLHACSGGRWMGLGDAPVALALSILVGTNAISGLLFSFWIGAVIGIGILVTHPKGHRMGIEVPFVPFLAAGYLLAFFTQWHPFLF